MCPPSALATTLGDASTTPHNIDSLIPQTEMARAAYAEAYRLLAPAILNHSIRVYLYAKSLAEHGSSEYSSDSLKHDLLFTACIFHDIGTTSQYDGPQRFEVEGADAAVNHLTLFDVSDAAKHDVWTAIAIHTSPGIAERIGELSRLVRVAVLTDFGGQTDAAISEVLLPLKQKFDNDFARSNIEKVLGDAVVDQAKRRPEKAKPASWPGILYRAWLADPKWDGVNKAF